MSEKLIRECCELTFSEKRKLIDRLLLSIKEESRLTLTSGDFGLTYETAIKAMCEVMGWDSLPDDQRAVTCLAKKILFFTMADEGEKPQDIASYFNVSPATAYHHIEAFRTMLKFPKSYKGAIKIYNQFKSKLYETER